MCLKKNCFPPDDTKVDIKPGLYEVVDYVFVPEDVWELLILWYGQMEDQIPIAKKVSVQFTLF